MDVTKLVRKLSEENCEVISMQENENTGLLFTEIHEGGLYFCSEQRKVTVCGQEIRCGERNT